MPDRACVHCGQPVPAGAGWRNHYCGAECRQQAHNERKRHESAVRRALKPPARAGIDRDELDAKLKARERQAIDAWRERREP